MSESSFKRSDIIGRLILDYQSTEELGKFEDILLDIERHQAQGFTSKAGLLGRQKQAFLWSQIKTIGEDSILVDFEPETQIEFPDSINSLIGYEIWTNAGNKAGVVTDYLINFEDGKIISYLFTSNGWKGITDGVYCLSPEDVVSVGSKRLIANNEAVENAQQYAEGIGATINKVTEFIKEDYQKTLEDLNVAKEGTQVLASQASEKTQVLASQATEKFQEITHQSASEEDEKQLTSASAESNAKIVESETDSETVQ